MTHEHSMILLVIKRSALVATAYEVGQLPLIPFCKWRVRLIGGGGGLERYSQVEQMLARTWPAGHGVYTSAT